MGTRILGSERPDPYTMDFKQFRSYMCGWMAAVQTRLDELERKGRVNDSAVASYLSDRGMQ